MKYTIARSIAMLFLVLDTKPLSEGIGINNYSRLINDIHRYYRTSCIIFVRSGNCDLHTTTLVHMWSREFSRQQVMTMTTTFSDLTSKYNEYQENVTRPLFVVLLDTRETMDEFAKTTRGIKPISFPIWFVVFLQRPGNSLEKYCWHPTDNIFNVDVRTEMLVLCYDRPTLVEWYAIRDNRTRTFDLATWSPDNGLILKTRKNLYARRSDMFGEVVRVVLVENSPLVSLENGTLGGFLGLLLTELTKAMNFSVEILDPVEGFGGWSHQQKIWTGAIGQLVINKADIGVSAFTMTTRRRNVIDFTMPLVRSRYRLYFKEPEQATVQWNLYLQAFSFDIWIALVMIIIVTSILLTIMKKTKNRYFSMNLMSDNYIKVWGIYCQQSLSESPRELSMRLVFFSIYISSIIILAIYSATLVSFLTLNLPKLPFSTLEDYVNDGTYKLIVLQNSAEYDIPTRMKDPVFLKMYDLLEEKKYLPTTLAEGFKQVCHREKLAFYTTMVFKEAMNRYIRCRVVYIDTGRIDNMGLTLSKGNPYTGFINYHLRRFHLNGVMDKLRNKYLIRNSRPKIYILGGIVDIYDITPTLTIVVGSMILALFILLIEKKYYSFKTLSKNKESFIKKVSHNVGAKNKMRKRNDEKNLRHQEFYNKPIIYYGYWP